MALQRTLVEHGFGVDGAGSGGEVLMTAFKKYGLVNPDVQMLGMGGI
ncbi:hypothetical protein [Pedobacter agri]|nr:hypothetical protein [Pedobacter agri]